jgi:acyl carrier protein
VGRGYLNRVELSGKKFVPVPFLPDERMYCSGDLARRRGDGNLEFAGRSDRQVKIRGFRIELAEIENRLLAAVEIKEAVVSVRKDEKGNQYLCAYVVSKKKIDTSGLRNTLSKHIPGYMIPAFFVQLDRIPLTSNNKIDRNALPEPELKVGEEYSAPRNEFERKMVRIWADILGIDSDIIGISSNFFELGGHSLKATILTSKIHEEFNVNLPLVEIFEKSTVNGLSEYIKGLAKDRYVSIQAAEEKEYYPLSSAQTRLYFLQQMESESTAYNVPAMVKLTGVLDKEKWEETFKKLINRHESLRTSFEMIDEELFQRIHREVEFGINYYDNDGGEEESKAIEIFKNFIRPFVLSKAPLLRAALIRIGERTYKLAVDLHHIIADGFSMNILMREFSTVYIGEELPGLRLQYRDFSEWQNSERERTKIKQQGGYWLKQFTGEIPVLNIPTDFPRPKIQSFEDGDLAVYILGKDLTGKIRKLLLKAGITMNILFFGVCNILLYKYTRQEDIIVGSAVTGRTHADLQNMIGMFVNMLGIRNRPGKNKTSGEFLLEVKKNLLEAYDNQDYQYEELVVELGLQGDISRSPLFNVVLEFNNIDIGETEILDIPVDFDNLENERFKHEFKASKFDLLLGVEEDRDHIIMKLLYSTALFARFTVENLLKHFSEILEQVVENREVKLKDIKISHGLSAIKSDRFRDDPEDFEF